MRQRRSGYPRKAIVLAAGVGTRLRPLSYTIPKPLLPIWNKPVLGHTLERLESWGVREVLVNLHYRADDIAAYLRDNRWGLEIALSFEPEIRGTGGALRAAEWFLDDDPFWMVNADILFDVDPAALMGTHARRSALATLWMDDTRGPRSVDVAPDGRIRNFSSPRPGTHDTATFCGLHLLDKRILNFVNERGADSIIDAYHRALKKRHLVLGVTAADAYWRDIGNLPAYLEAHRSTLTNYRKQRPGGAYVSAGALRGRKQLSRAGATISGATCLDPGARVHPNARLVDSIVTGATDLGPRTRLNECVIAPGLSRLDRISTGIVSPLEAYPPAHPIRECVQELGFDSQRCTVDCLGHRGSARSVYRIVHAGGSLMIVVFDPARDENTHFVGAARFLKRAGLPVPEIIHDEPRHHYYACEDLGHLDLNHARHAPRTRVRLYRKVLDTLHALHRPSLLASARRKLSLAPAFSPDLFAWEHTLFIEEFALPFLGIDSSTARRVERALREASRRLADESPVLIHRDLQSSNILVQGATPYLIDFQGMREGPASYDLASLIYDPYAVLPLADRLRLLKILPQPRVHLSANVPYAAIQRLCQACGAYGRLSRTPGGESFLGYLEPARRNLLTVLREFEAFDALRLIARHSWNVPRRPSVRR